MPPRALLRSEPTSVNQLWLNLLTVFVVIIADPRRFAIGGDEGTGFCSPGVEPDFALLPCWEFRRKGKKPREGGNAGAVSWRITTGSGFCSFVGAAVAEAIPVQFHPLHE